MVDKYLWGTVGRISPEAPVPIVEVEKETERLGGAANVANNVKSLGGWPLLVGVVGDDSNGTLLTKLLAEQGCPINGIVKDASRPTTIKTRVIAHSQHVVRIDNEQKRDISSCGAGSDTFRAPELLSTLSMALSSKTTTRELSPHR